MSDIRVSPDLEALNRACARAIVHAIRGGTGGGNRFLIALAGGESPRGLYRTLAAEHRDGVPWGQVHLFWGDERYVPLDDPRSNYRLVRDSLLGGVPIPRDNVHPMPTHFPDPRDAARAYERDLRTYFPGPWPRLDLILLGVGSDGHTASLFPGSPALREQERWVVDVRAPAPPPVRLTLTLPVLNHAAAVFFLVAGVAKADAVRQALTGPRDPLACPAGAVRPVDGDPVWWLDEGAAALLRRDRDVR